MNKNTKTDFRIAGAALVLPLLVLLLVGGSTLIQAQPAGRGGGFEDRGPMLDRVIERLDLSPAQEEQFEELLAENREDHRTQREAVKNARQALADLGRQLSLGLLKPDDVVRGFSG